MVFEDLQWADSGLLAFVDHLVEWSRGVPIYVVGLARPELLETRPDWGAGKRNFTSLALEPLTPDAMRALLAGLVPGLPDDAAARIVARADGVPLYAVEIVRMLVAQGSLEAADGVYRPVGDLADLAVPDTLHSLVAARLDALAPADRAMLQAAAVLGQSFTVDGLAAVASLDAEDVERRLGALVRRELIVRDLDPRSVERGQFAFVQSLVREVAYSTLARRDRKARHLAAARHFETLVDQELAGALATHYLAALRNAAEGPEADALAAQARIALRAAGDRALALGAQEQALGFFRDALQVTLEPLERAALLERAGRAASAAGFPEEAEQLLAAAIELLRAAGDRSAAARVTGRLGDAMFAHYRLDAALALVEPAASEFADLGEDPGYASLLGQLARFQMLRQVDFGATVATADRALAIAERLDRVDLVADVLVTRGVALTAVGRAYEGIGCLEAGLRLAERHGLLATEIRARTNLGGPLSDRDPRAAFDVSRVGLELARRFGHRLSVSMLIGNASTAAIESGEWDWARAEIRTGLDQAVSDEERITLLSFLGPLLIEEGANADAEIDEAVGWLAAHVEEEPSLASMLSGARSARSLQHGELAAASSWYLEGGSLDPYNAVAAFSEATLLALLVRDHERARAGVEALRATCSHAALALLLARVGDAGIAALDGRTDAARAGLLAVYGDLRDLGAVRKQALTGLVMATLLGTDDAGVRAAVDESRHLFEQMGAGLWLARLDAVVADSVVADPAARPGPAAGPAAAPASPAPGSAVGTASAAPA
jgi:tetratricopeptide (TPR) repeat protein